MPARQVLEAKPPDLSPSDAERLAEVFIVAVRGLLETVDRALGAR